MNKYEYRFEVPTYTTIDIAGVTTDIALYNGGVYELPKNNAHVKVLVAQGKLVQVKNK